MKVNVFSYIILFFVRVHCIGKKILYSSFQGDSVEGTAIGYL